MDEKIITAVKADLKARWFDSPAMIDDCVDSTVDALAEAAQVPGFVAVPVEPTQDMLIAMTNAASKSSIVYVGAIYRAMLAARPDTQP